jgi:GH18 family chitinase
MGSSVLSKVAVAASTTALFAASLASAEGAWFSFLKDCPQTCSSSGISSANWTAYHDTKSLVRCKEPMLLDFAIHNPIDDPTKRLTLFACAGPATGDDTTCDLGSESSAVVQSAWSGSNDGADADSVLHAAQQAVSHLSKADCSTTEPTTAFGYLNGSFVGVYSGGQMHNQGAIDLVQQLIDGIQKGGPKGDFQIMQVCGSNRTADYVVGVAAANPSTPGDISSLAAVQKAVMTWSKGECVTGLDSSSTANIKVWEQQSDDFSTQHNVTARGELVARGNCRTIQVASGNTCGTLATRCGISPADFTKYNPNSKLCSTLAVGEYVCCSAGTLPDLKPKPNADGTCATHFVKGGDDCSTIAASNMLTVANLEDFNKNTWGWMGCDDLQASMNMCLSTGDPPLPAPIANAVCGPQVPGTTRPNNGTTFAHLNPCQLNACCDVWGQCGIDADFCTPTKSATGAPGTAAKGTNGCISNCGTDIVKGDAPSSVISLGYFEAWNADRPCLKMDVRSLAGYSYTVVHFAFANITEDFNVDVSAAQDSFNYFKAMTGFKKIISFGGWSFSTSLDSYPIFRSGVTAAQRLTFAKNVAAFVKANNLDGADFDWEYPGAPDIPGIPPGNPSDGPNYLDFLKTLKPLMPSGTTVSIAAPASFWYLKGFPIKAMSEILDYIVYMTYDLHGQWDWNNAWANPGCPNGNCLRSHINSTETQLALAMITKAGVNSGKVVVGVASYGRSFQMTDPTCTGPHCTFTGPLSGATPGECTNTAGYISNAELNDIAGLASGSGKRDGASSVSTWHDDDSDSDIMTFGSNWVSYMSEKTMASRVASYLANNFAGSTNWAVDLAKFVTPYDGSDPGSGDVDWHHVYCTSAETDINIPADQRWTNFGCDDAWNDGLKYWKAPGHQAQEFSAELAQFYNATGLKLAMDCNALNVDNGCGGTQVDCANGVTPAGYFILNSMQQVGSVSACSLPLLPLIMLCHTPGTRIHQNARINDYQCSNIGNCTLPSNPPHSKHSPTPPILPRRLTLHPRRTKWPTSFSR